MQALESSITTYVADPLFIPSAPPKSSQLRVAPRPIPESSIDTMSLRGSTAFAQAPDRIEVPPFDPVDGTARFLCALFASVAAIGVWAGTIALMVN